MPLIGAGLVLLFAPNWLNTLLPPTRSRAFCFQILRSMQDATFVLKEILKGGTVSYQAIFAKALKNVPAAVFLSQAYFWQENALYKKADEHREFEGLEYFSKTAADWYDATGLSDEQQKTAREKLISFGILTEVKAGIPARLYYRIEIDAIVSVVTSFLNTRNQVSVKPGNSTPENPETVHRETRNQVSVKPGNSTPENPETVHRETRKQYTVKPGNTYIESNREYLESKNESIKKGEFSDFEEIGENQDQTFKEKKNSKSRTGPRAAAFSDADIAQHLESKEQQFFAQVLSNGSWNDYLAHRKEKDRFTYKSAQSAAQAVKILLEVSKGNADTALDVVNQSRGMGWSGIFPLKQPTKIQQNVHTIANSPSFAGAFT